MDSYGPSPQMKTKTGRKTRRDSSLFVCFGWHDGFRAAGNSLSAATLCCRQQLSTENISEPLKHLNVCVMKHGAVFQLGNWWCRFHFKGIKKKMKTHVAVLPAYMNTDFGTSAHTHNACLSGQLSRSADMFSSSFQWIKIYFMLIAAWGNTLDTVYCQWWHPITASVNDCTFRTAPKSHSIILLTVYY